MIGYNTTGTAITQAFIDAVRSDSPEWLSKIQIRDGADTWHDLDTAVDSWQITKGSVTAPQFGIGSVVGNVFKGNVRDISENIDGKDMRVLLGVNTGADYEWVQVGIFTVAKAFKTRYATTITAYGRLISRTNYAMPVLATQTVATVIQEIETTTGCTVTVPASALAVEITEPLGGLSLFQVIGIIAGLVGGYATETYDGNITIAQFSNTETLSVDTGMMLELPNSAENNFTVTGVQCIVQPSAETEEGTIPAIEYTSGSPVNVVVEDIYATQASFNILANGLVGYTYRPSDIDLSLGDPRLEGTDVLSVTDLDGTVYRVPCHQLTHTYDGGFSTAIRSAQVTTQDEGIDTGTPITSQLRVLASGLRGTNSIASEAYQISANTDQYFWFTETGTDTGAHITEIPQDEWNDSTSPNYHSGGNLLARSNGIAVRDGLTELATFGANGAQIGKDNEVQLALTDSLLNFKYQNTNVFRMGMSILPKLAGFIGIGDSAIARTDYSADSNRADISIIAGGNSSVLSTPYGKAYTSRTASWGEAGLRAGDGTQTNRAVVSVNDSTGYSPEILLDVYYGTSQNRTYVKISNDSILVNGIEIGKVEAYVPTLPSTVGFSDFRVRRYGAVVSITVSNVTKASTGNNVLFTLPAGWRPPANTTFMVIAPASSITTGQTNLSLRLTVGANGEVALYNYRSSAISGNTNASGVLTYIATQ